MVENAKLKYRRAKRMRVRMRKEEKKDGNEQKESDEKASWIYRRNEVEPLDEWMNSQYKQT